MYIRTSKHFQYKRMLIKQIPLQWVNQLGRMQFGFTVNLQ